MNKFYIFYSTDLGKYTTSNPTFLPAYIPQSPPPSLLLLFFFNGILSVHFTITNLTFPSFYLTTLTTEETRQKVPQKPLDSFCQLSEYKNRKTM